jgi:acyl-[acyl-carrier-protein]-phospholipid O-acyltransferase/long-chain-fatty-acid--[acyl-carrier-protein] ligase
MLLHHRFIEVAKNQREKMAFLDRTAGREVTYSRALIASLLLPGNSRNMTRGSLE